MPGVRFESWGREGVVLGELVLLGRSIPVISPEQLEERLLQIGCSEEVVAGIVDNLFGFRVAAEAPIAAREVIESLA